MRGSKYVEMEAREARRRKMRDKRDSRVTQDKQHLNRTWTELQIELKIHPDENKYE